MSMQIDDLVLHHTILDTLPHIEEIKIEIQAPI